MEARLGWKVLVALLRSKLVTNSDSEVVQVMAEHVARYVRNVDEGQQNGGEEDSDVRA
jgi:hypothetical protein